MLKVLSRTAAAAALAVAALTVAPQSASALQFTFNGAEKSPFLNVNYSRVSPAKSAGSQGAGAFKMTGAPFGAFIAWCFDLDNTISTGTFDYSLNPALLTLNPPGKYVNGADVRIQKLFDASYNLAITTSNVTSAAFQLAIWNVLYDDDFSLTGGNFTGFGDGNTAADNAAITSAAKGYLTAASTYNSNRKWQIFTFDNTDNPSKQDLGVATAIPLPAAVWLLLGVSGALVAAKRRSAGKAA